MPYKTDLDLRRLFGQLPRADDGSEATLPNIIPDTIQAVVELFPSAADVPIDALAVERMQVVLAAPGTLTPPITVPAGENWIVWRAVVGHSDAALRNITCLMAQPGVGSGLLALRSSETKGLNEQFVVDRPVIAKPGAVLRGFSAASILLGNMSLDILFTRFTIPNTIPQVPIGF